MQLRGMGYDSYHNRRKGRKTWEIIDIPNLNVNIKRKRKSITFVFPYLSLLQFFRPFVIHLHPVYSIQMNINNIAEFHFYKAQLSSNILIICISFSFHLHLPKLSNPHSLNGLILYYMSVNSTPRGASFDNIPVISPIDYFNAEKIQSTIPCLVIKKLGDIIDEFFKLKPQLIKKENEIKGLYTYNQKMIETIESFMDHERKIVRKYNKLCQIYVKHFKEYLNAKNVDVNFKDLMNPLTSISQTFSMNDWKVEIQDNPLLTVKKTYEEMLLKVIKRCYLNEDNSLQGLLERELERLPNSPEHANIEHIRSEIRELNTTTPTTANMFDQLEKRKNIQSLIRELDEGYCCEYTIKDLNFIDQVSRIHGFINNPTAEKLKFYLDHENQIRRSLKKKSRKFRESLQMEFQRLQTENSEIKQEIQQIRKRNSELQIQRNEYKNKLSYMQLKTGISGKKQKDKNSSNTSLIEDTLNLGIKQTNKKLELRISELQSENNRLKQALVEKQEANQHLNVKRELMTSNSEMQELRLKLCSKLMELGILDTETMTSGEMFDIIMEKMTTVKHYELRDTGNNEHEYIDIKITESLPIAEMRNASKLQTPPQFSESIILREPSIMMERPSTERNSKEKNILESEEKDLNRETQVHDINATQESGQPPVYLQLTKKQLKIGNKEDHQVDKLMRKNNFASPLTSSALLSISERKSIDQQSKMNDGSKIFKEKSFTEERFHQKAEEQLKHNELMMNMMKIQEEKNQLTLENKQYLKEIEKYEALFAEQKMKPLSIFENIEKDLKILDVEHGGQIENLCQGIVKELSKLQGEQFVKRAANIQDAIRNVKSNLNPLLNINEIPVLSQEDNLFKSENIIAQIFGGKREESSKRKNSVFMDDKSKLVRLSLNSGEVKIQIKPTEKSLCFSNRENPTPSRPDSKADKQNLCTQKEQSSIKIDHDQLIDIVMDFQGTSRKRKDHNNSENSLKFSQSNLKNSRDDDIKSSMRMFDKIDKKIMNDAEFMAKLQLKLEEIKNCSDSGSDLYWFYKRYRQSMEALESTEAKLKEFERKKETCMSKIVGSDGSLSRPKLEEKIYFLQQKIAGFEEREHLVKQEYEYNVTEHIKQIDDIRETAIDKLIKGIFSENYNLA